MGDLVDVNWVSAFSFLSKNGYHDFYFVYTLGLNIMVTFRILFCQFECLGLIQIQVYTCNLR
jgi:hypothetical protein